MPNAASPHRLSWRSRGAKPCATGLGVGVVNEAEFGEDERLVAIPLRDAEQAQQALSDKGLATYATPESAVRGFLHATRYTERQHLLLETPADIPETFTPDLESARAVIDAVRADGRSLLTEPEAKAVLDAFTIPVVDSLRVATPAADELGYPAAVKILSPDTTHKSDVGGVILDLAGAYAVRGATGGIQERIAELVPEARTDGFTVQQMARLTQIDYDREMAFIAVGPDGDTLVVVRTVTDPDNEKTEFAIVVRSDLKGRGWMSR